MTAPIKVQKYSDDDECLAPGCNRKPEKTQLCSTHYRRKARGRGWGPPLKKEKSFTQRKNYVLGEKVEVGRYIHIYRPDLRILMGESRNLLPEHRVVYFEHKMNRPFVKGENVHHKNGNTHDNSIENLELWNTSQPAGQRVEDKIAWAKEILALYKVEEIKD